MVEPEIQRAANRVDSNPVELAVQLDRNAPFKRLTIDAYFNVITQRRVLVMWAMGRSFTRPGPYTFTLQRGYALNDNNFVDVAITVDQPWAYDKAPIFPSKGTDVFYRVKLVTGTGEIFYSDTTQLGVDWGHYDWTIAREIIRKETLLLYKRTGTRGWLLKRRLFGEPCTDPACVDQVTGQILNPNCPDCYGTGIVGGYYAALEYWVTMNPTQRIKKLDVNLGVIAESMETVRALAHPSPDPNDVWVQANTNQRYIIQSDIVASARHRGVDLVLNLRLQERPTSDGIYLVPTPCR